MSWSIPLGRIAGIKIFVHLTFFLLLFWFICNERSEGGNWEEVVQAVAVLLSAFFCVVLHELGHALTARRYGIQTQDIIILPIGGVARLERLPEDPREELIVAFAGPLTSAVIAFLLGMGLLIATIVSRYNFNFALSQTGFWTFDYWFVLCIINLIFVIFNLIPAFPMDGGRVLRSILAMKLGKIRGTKIAAGTGQIIAVVFAGIGIYTADWILVIVAAFVFFAARAELRETLRQGMFGNSIVQACMCSNPPVINAAIPVKDVLTQFLYKAPSIYLVEDAFGNIVGTLESDDIARAVSRKQTGAPIGDICTKPRHRARKNMLIRIAQRLLQEEQINALPVMEAGKCVGLFSVTQLNRWLELSAACQESGVTIDLNQSSEVNVYTLSVSDASACEPVILAELADDGTVSADRANPKKSRVFSRHPAGKTPRELRPRLRWGRKKML